MPPKCSLLWAQYAFQQTPPLHPQASQPTPFSHSATPPTSPRSTMGPLLGSLSYTSLTVPHLPLKKWRCTGQTDLKKMQKLTKVKLEPVAQTGWFYSQDTKFISSSSFLPHLCVSGTQTDAVHLALERQSSSLSPKCPGEPLAFGQH